MATSHYSFKPEDFMNLEAYKSFFGNTGASAEEMAAASRRHMEVMTAASREAVESANALAQINAEYAKQTMEDLAAYWRDLMSSGPDMNEKAEIQGNAARETCAKALAHNKEVAELIQKSQEKFMRKINDQVAETVRTAAKSAAPKAKK